MNVSRSLTFLWTPWSVVALDRGRAGHGRLLLRRLAAQRLSAVDGAARAAAAGAGRHWSPSCSISPNGSRSSGPRKSRRSPCCWDASASMETRDVVAGRPADGLGRRPAREAIAPLADPAAWDKLRERMNVVDPAVLASRRPGTAPTCTSRWPTRREKIAEPARHRAGLRRRLERRPAAGAGRRAAADARACRSSPCRWAAATRLPDVELLEPRRADLRRRRQVGAHSVHDRQLAAARVRHDGHAARRPTATRSRRKSGSPPMGRTSDWLVWKPKAIGDFTLTLDDPQARRRDAWPTTTS